VEIFAAVVRTAPYGKYTARAQFDIGLAREKQGVPDAALQAYQAVVDKFPNQPSAIDAQYQIGYIWLVAARHGTKDPAATTNAKTAFQDFLFRYPNSEKAAQARANLKLLEGKQTSTSMQVAQFYDKQKNYRAAVIYYNEVIRQQPGSKESDQAKKRIDHLRAKVGDAKLQPGFTAAEAEAKKNKEAGTAEHRDNEREQPAGQQPVSRPEQAASGGGLPPKESPTPSAAGSPPALPPATDLALPPVSLDPGRRGESSSAPAALPTPEASVTPASGLLMP
jgi:outer membrane protein assembly factor BamD